jgi:L-fuconolactonase
LYNPTEYDWIDEPMRAIRRDFLPPHLEAEMRAVGVDGAVTVQARQTLEETEWLLAMAKRYEWLLGVVGWVPLIHADRSEVLGRVAADSRLKGVRHILQGEPDPEYMLRDDFNAGISALRQFGLKYDILIFERQLPQTIRFVDRHPDQVFVLDHIAKPRIGERLMSPWRENVRELARRPNVYCKLSGMATEADYELWTKEQLRPYFDVVLEAFQPRRLMFGSDWPVSTVACGYGQWVQIVEGWTRELSEDEKEWFWAKSAREAYGIG